MTDDGRGPGYRRRSTITLLVLCQSTQSLVVGGVALFLPLIRGDLGLSFAQAGTLAAASSLTYALMQIPSGYLADRFTPRRLFLLGLLGTNALAFGFATLHSYPLLVVTQALSGCCRSLVFAPGLLLISNQFPAARRATAMGLYVAGGFSSNILLSLLGPVLVGPLGWQRLFLVFAAAGLLVLGLYRWLGDDGVSERAGAGMRLRELPGLLRHRILWTTGFIQFVRLAVVQGLTFWLPTYLVADRGYPLAVAGLVTALGAAVTAPSNVLGGYLSDRLGRPLAVIGVSLGVLAVTTALLTLVHGLVPLLSVVAVSSVFVQVYFGPLFALPIQRLGARTAGVTSGFGNFCANLGGFVFSYALGVVRDATGSFQAGFLTLGGLCVLALLATVSLRTVGRTEPAAGAPAGSPATGTPGAGR
ncbi:MFS transporter [Planosporangium sp. 12N6]|uniref:MFS transporter n=1 Tax=Planosporangium spinosum TaxID=3402278 RepID=UPI003CE9DEE1